MTKANIKGRATITQVAKLAGVTIGTVSHVINGTRPISPETTERVNAAIKELNYIPNPIAKSLRSKKNYMIGLLVPNLNNTFYTKIASVFMDEALDAGYGVQILGYEYSLKRERIEIERLKNNVDIAVIFNGYGDEKEIAGFIGNGGKVILVDRHADSIEVPYIEFDNHAVMFQLVGMLKEKGYKRIGYFSEPVKFTNLEDRFNGYRKALLANGYEPSDKDVYIRDDLRLDNLKNGYNYMTDILKEHGKEALPDVWIASSDLLAIGAIKAITDFGYKVPDDFGVIGFDNTEISKYLSPALTTIDQDQLLMGRKLWEMAREVGSGNQVENIKLEQKLIIRESC